MPKLLFTLFAVTSFFHSHAQGYNAGARSASLSGSSLCLSDAWAYFHNPAATASLKAFTAGAYYDARFLARELQNQALAVALPLKVGVLSGGGQFSGYEQYRNTRAGVGYALQLGERFAAGVQLNFQHLRFGGNYGSASTATAEAGILAKVSDRWKLGASVMNIGRQRLKISSETRYTTIMRIGALYQPSQKVGITAEVRKEVIHPVCFKSGIEYYPGEAFVVRAGVQTFPAGLAFGVGYRKKAFRIDTGSAYHQVLGFAPHFGFTIQLGEHEKD